MQEQRFSTMSGFEKFARCDRVSNDAARKMIIIPTSSGDKIRLTITN